MEEKKPKKKQDSELELKWEKATPIHYARFHQAVPPAKDVEPVNEFRLNSKDKKYVVEAIRWSWGDGVIYKAYGELDLVPEANVQYVRFTL